MAFPKILLEITKTLGVINDKLDAVIEATKADASNVDASIQRVNWNSAAYRNQLISIKGVSPALADQIMALEVNQDKGQPTPAKEPGPAKDLPDGVTVPHPAGDDATDAQPPAGKGKLPDGVTVPKPDKK